MTATGFAGELRAACAEVARRARSVHVDETVLERYAVALEIGSPDGDTGGHADPGAGLAECAAYWLSLDAINFGSGWFPTLRKSDGLSGYRTVAAAWRRRCERLGVPSAAELARIGVVEVAEILGQDRDHELMDLFADSLRDLGAHLSDEYGGESLALVADVGDSAIALASRLGGWACFADRSRYEELSLPFLKRAQIVAADLQRAGVADWRDRQALTIFADNLVPHVLRLDGVLGFEDLLVQRIERGELIEHGSAEEVEIRACALHAVELMVVARSDGVSAATLDQLLWNRGQAPSYKARPRHRSRCTAY